MLPEVTSPGYYRLDARISDGIQVKAAGFDDIFAVDCMDGSVVPDGISVVETDGAVASFLKQARGITVTEFDPGESSCKCIIVGTHDFGGGDNDGKCEVSDDIPCAWAQIVDRLTKQGKLNQLKEIIPAKEWTTARDGGPRRLIHEEAAP